MIVLPAPGLASQAARWTADRRHDLSRDAAEDGLNLTPQSIKLLIHDMPRDRKLRIIKRMRRQLRPELMELYRGLQ